MRIRFYVYKHTQPRMHRMTYIGMRFFLFTCEGNMCDMRLFVAACRSNSAHVYHRA